MDIVVDRTRRGRSFQSPIAAAFLLATALTIAAEAIAPARAFANDASKALRAQASSELYNLDREQAVATYRRAVAADPQDSGAYRGLASALWLAITFRRGGMTVDDYMGRIARPDTHAAAPPPPDM